jgi:hypothetical protein
VPGSYVPARTARSRFPEGRPPGPARGSTEGLLSFEPGEHLVARIERRHVRRRFGERLHHPARPNVPGSDATTAIGPAPSWPERRRAASAILRMSEPVITVESRADSSKRTDILGAEERMQDKLHEEARDQSNLSETR